MKEFLVTIEETFSRKIKVQAESMKDAIHQVETDYYDGNIVLDYQDHDGTDFSANENTEN